MIYKTLLQTIGNTPIIKILFDSQATILAKLEYLNPSGSLKDRSALFMIEEAERKGIIKPGGTLIEASSGNQGIATAMIGAAKGYKVIITTTNKFSQEKIKTITAYGAHVVVCPWTEFLEDPQSYHSQALTVAHNTPNSFLLNQYYNLSNSAAHYNLLGPELWKQTQGTITHYFAATGTCGTITGVGSYLKEQNPTIKIIGVDAANSYRSTQANPKPYKLEGIGVDFDSPILKAYGTIIDEFLTVTDDQGIAMLKNLAQNYGLLVGPSSGALAYAVQDYAKKLCSDDVAIMILGDSGRAYLSKEYYQENQENYDYAPRTPAQEKMVL